MRTLICVFICAMLLVGCSTGERVTGPMAEPLRRPTQAIPSPTPTTEAAPSTSTPPPPSATAPPSPTAPATATPEPTPTLTAEQAALLTAQLIQAAGSGDTAAVQALLRQGADINGRDDQGRTPAMAATYGNHPATVNVLIQAGADIHLQDNLLNNPFLYAGAEGMLEIVRLTIAAGADTRITNRFGGTALIPASEHAHVEVVQELLTHTDVDVNHINNLGWTALLEAVMLGDGGERHQQVVQLLIDHGADVNLADHDGVTPLAHAQARGFTELAAILQRAGAR